MWGHGGLRVCEQGRARGRPRSDLWPESQSGWGTSDYADFQTTLLMRFALGIFLHGLPSNGGKLPRWGKIFFFALIALLSLPLSLD